MVEGLANQIPEVRQFPKLPVAVQTIRRRNCPLMNTACGRSGVRAPLTDGRRLSVVSDERPW